MDAEVALAGIRSLVSCRMAIGIELRLAVVIATNCRRHPAPKEDAETR
jgi:hypothetical protein